MITVTAVEAMEQILAHGRNTADDSTAQVALSAGQFSAQGDVNFWALPDALDGIDAATPSLQLAPGNTPGSRHCIAADDAHLVEFYKLKRPSPLHGPVLRFNGSVTIEHPEHGNQVLPPGWYLVSFQRRHADEIKRIQD